MKENNDAIAFNGSLSILSNFYPSPFYTENTLFSCNEQYFQFKKAQASGASRVAAQILATNDPVQHKQLGQLTFFRDEDWASEDAMKKGAILKFSQNKQCLDYLMSTTNKLLHHSNAYDNEWGTGIPLSNKEVLTKRFEGKNRLGKILMDIRDNKLVTLQPNPNPTGMITLPSPFNPPAK